MGFWRRTFGLASAASSVADAPTISGLAFDGGTVEADSGVLYGTPTLDDYIFRGGKINRAEALRCAPVKRARDLIAGTIGQWPLVVLDPARKPATLFTPNMFTQPERGVAPSVTVTNLVEDLLLDERSWYRVTARGWHGRPVEGHLLDLDTVSVQPEYRHFPEGSCRVWPERENLIRFDSPTPGLLSSPALRAAILLERAAMRHLDGTPPLDYFTPGDADADELDDDDVLEVLEAWKEARRTRSTAYVPSSLKYNVAGWDPDKLQLAEARNFAVLEVARLTGLDGEDLSVSTTSRTYFNGQDRRRVRIEDVCGPYMAAIEGRLSMDDVTPAGYTVAFDTSSYLRLDDLAAAQADEVLIRSKVLHPDEARAKRGLEPRGEDYTPSTPATTETKETAQ